MNIEEFINEMTNNVYSQQKMSFITWFVECQLKYKITDKKLLSMIDKAKKELRF